MNIHQFRLKAEEGKATISGTFKIQHHRINPNKQMKIKVFPVTTFKD